jgi:hypothetical protein
VPVRDTDGDPVNRGGWYNSRGDIADVRDEWRRLLAELVRTFRLTSVARTAT